MKKTIKIMVMLLFAATLTTMISCSKSNDDLIVGKWKVSQANGGLIDTGVGDIWEFKTGGILFIRDGAGAFSYSISGDEIIIGGLVYGNITCFTSKSCVLDFGYNENHFLIILFSSL